MTTSNDEENRTGEFSEVSQRRSEGIAGPSREVSQRDQNPSCTGEGAGRENNELAWAQRHIPEEPVTKGKTAPRLVQRKTEITGCGIASGKKRASILREKAEHLTIDIPAEALENNGDLVFLLLDHMHRIAERQDKKFERVYRRLSVLEGQEREP
jgi:hypothetical protein